MATRLTSLGYARVFRHPRTGELAVDTDSLRRGGGGFSGVDFGEDYDDFEGDDYDDDFEGDDDDDDDFEGDYDDFGDDYEFDGDDDFEGDDDFGAKGRRRRKRLNRRMKRLQRRSGRVSKKLGKSSGGRKRSSKSKGSSEMQWGMTAVSGTDTLTEAGAASVKIRLQHHFRAQDITFTGSANGAKVTSIFFGDRVVWSSSDGIDVSVFGSTSFLRGLLKGQSLRAGLDITVNGSLTGAGDFAVTMIGQKPVTAQC